MILAGTGHRSQKLGGFLLPNPTYIALCKEIEIHLLELKPTKVISGLAQGFDSYLAHVALKLKIPVIGAIPFKGQEKAWPESAQRRYHKLISQFESTHIVCEGDYAAYKLQLRNHWMVDHADKILSCHDGSTGGTNNCIIYANLKNKPIINIDPRTLVLG
jgi:uncharacterized phage-like protein YoqJ